jgi:hypothetical protein
VEHCLGNADPPANAVGFLGRRILACAWSMALAATVGSAANVQIHPGPAAPGSEQYAHFPDESLVEFADPCVEWVLATRQGPRIELLGLSPAAGAPCPAIDQVVPLGPLPAGPYTLVARFATSRAVYSQVSFRIGGNPLEPEVSLAPTRPTPTSAVSLGLSLLNSTCSHLYFGSPPLVEGDRITFEGVSLSFPILCPPGLWHEGFFFTLPPLSPGRKTVEFVAGHVSVASLSFTVAETPQSLFLGEHFANPEWLRRHFEVQLDWRDRQGGEHRARATRLTMESGQFSFFDPSNVELVVKVLDGRALNEHLWVFAASMTDLAYTLTVTEHTVCDICSPPFSSRSSTYTVPAGLNVNVLDTRAFPAQF